jgi:hypothetical protein
VPVQIWRNHADVTPLTDMVDLERAAADQVGDGSIVRARCAN